jgi:hypothetical protein
VQHSRSRSQNPSLVLKPSYCKTSTFQASFFNRVVKPWNFVCKIASTDKFASLSIFKRFLHATYSNLVTDTFNVDMPCTWSLTRDCSCHIVPKLHYVGYIFTVNRFFKIYLFIFCYVVLLLFRGCALHVSFSRLH